MTVRLSRPSSVHVNTEPFTPEEREHAHLLFAIYPLRLRFRARVFGPFSDLAEWGRNLNDPDQRYRRDAMLTRLEGNPRIDHRAAVAAVKKAKFAASWVLESGSWIDHRRAAMRSLDQRRKARSELQQVLNDADFASLGLYMDDENHHHLRSIDAAIAALDREIEFRTRLLDVHAGAPLRRAGRRPGEPWIATARHDLKAAGVPGDIADELLRLVGLTRDDASVGR